MWRGRSPNTHGATLPERAGRLGPGSCGAFRSTPPDATLFLCARLTAIAHHLLLSIRRGQALPPEKPSLLAMACSLPVLVGTLFSSHTPQSLIGHHPLSGCQAECRLIGADPNHAVGQPKRAARCWDGALRSLSPCQLLPNQVHEAFQRLGARDQPAVYEEGRGAGHPDAGALLQESCRQQAVFYCTSIAPPSPRDPSVKVYLTAPALDRRGWWPLPSPHHHTSSRSA